MAEERLLARTPDGELMRRAAFGLAVEPAKLLAERVGTVPGAGSCCWSAQATTAATHCGPGLSCAGGSRGDGRAARAGPCARRPGWPRCAGPAAGSRRGRFAVVRAADLVVDGIVGLSATARSGRTPPSWSAEVTAPILAVDLPSGVDPDTGAVDRSRGGRHVTVTFGARKPGHVLPPAPCTRGRRAWSTSACGRNSASPTCTRLDRGGRRRHLAGARPERRQVHPGRDRHRCRLGELSRRGRAGHGRRGARHVRHGPLRRHRGRRRPGAVAGGRRHRIGRRRRPRAGLGGRPRPRHRPGRRDVLCTPCSAADVPVCADADAITLLAKYPDLWDARDPAPRWC